MGIREIEKSLMRCPVSYLPLVIIIDCSLGNDHIIQIVDTFGFGVSIFGTDDEKTHMLSLQTTRVIITTAVSYIRGI